MPNKRITVYPGPVAIRVVGETSPRLNTALRGWTTALQQAAVENAARLDREDWQMLTTATENYRPHAEDTAPGVALAGAVSAAQSVSRAGVQWYGADAVQRTYALAAALRGMDYVHVWAVLIASRTFWDQHTRLNPYHDEWWHL